MAKRHGAEYWRRHPRVRVGDLRQVTGRQFTSLAGIGNWSVRELRRQIDSQYCERIELKNDAQLAEALDTPLRTMERWLKQLRKAGGIEFVGSPKTGGYHANAAP